MSIVIKDEDVKVNLSELLKAARDGKEVIITSGNVPIAKLVPAGLPAGERKPGSMPSLLSLPDEFYQPLSEDERAEWE